MRKILQRLFLAALLLTLLWIASAGYAASTELQIHADTNQDGTVSAEVVLDGTMTASGVQFALAYDDTRLQLTGWQDGDLKGSYTVNDASSGEVRLVWYSTEGASVSGESSVLKLSFKPLTSGDTSIRFDPAAMAPMLVDSSLATVDTKTSDTTVTVSSANTSTVSTTAAPAPTLEPLPLTFSPVPALTPTPPPLVQAAAPTPSPTPQSVGTVNTNKPVQTGTATDASEQTDKTAETSVRDEAGSAGIPAVPTVAEAVTPQPSAAQSIPVSPTPKVEAQIEVIHSPDKNSAYAWLWVLGGIGLTAAGYLVYRRIVKK